MLRLPLFPRALILFFVLLIFQGVGNLNADTQPPAKGKIVILVLDISGSMKPYFERIRQVLDRAVIKKLLDVGDYFELIPFGNDAKTMYSGQIFRVEDTDTIVNSLGAMKPDNDNTDIGTALKTALNQVVELKKQQFDLYQPLVLFLTDGDHQPPAGSPFQGKSVDDFFQDSLIGDKSLYDGWYVVGIGKNLVDLRRVAALAGREKYFLTIDDLDKLEAELNDWVSKIPPSVPLESGSVELSRVSMGGSDLGSSLNLVPFDARSLRLTLVSTYQKTPVKLEIIGARASFQTEDNSVTVPFTVNTETGVIELLPQASRTTNALMGTSGSPIGKGHLKLALQVTLNHVGKDYNLDFPVEFLSPTEILVRTWGAPAGLAILLLLLFLAFQLAKGYLPVPVTLEIVGKPTKGKGRSVAMSLGKKAEFGSKPGLVFKLDQAGSFSAVVGTLERVGKSGYRINTRDVSAFADPEKLSSYTMNSPLKLKTRDGLEVTIRFKTKKAR